MLFGCDSGGGGGGGGGGEAVGNKTIDLSGGNGTAGDGGIGNSISLYAFRDVTVKRTGGVNANFTVPGNNPKYIDCSQLSNDPDGTGNWDQFSPASDVTVNAFSSSDSLGAAGDYYLLYGSNDLKYDSDGGADAEAGDETVECIDIPSGVTVTLGLNFDSNNADSDTNHATGADRAVILLGGDLRVAGTLKTATLDTATGPDTNEPGLDPGSLQLEAHQVYVPATGTVDTSGGNNVAGRGGHGGNIDIQSYANSYGGFLEMLGTADCSGGDGTTVGGHACTLNDGVGLFSAYELYLRSYGRLIVRGSLLGNGGNGADSDGGNGGSILTEADSNLFFTGTLEANGGTGGVTGNGGSGGTVDFGSNTGMVNLTGTIDASGGNGGWDGGNASTFAAWNGYPSPIRSKATITMAGGNSTVDGNGGNGAYYEVLFYGGPLLLTGGFDGHGGDASGAGNSGGNGDAIYIEDFTGTDFGYGEGIAPDDIEMSMNIDLSGGAGESGGDAGYITVYADNNSGSVSPPAARILLKGYASFDISGGDSTSGNGGDAGYYEIYTEDTSSSIGGATAVGSIKSSVPVDGKGGDGAMTGSMSGGQGAWIQFETNGAAYVRDSDTTVAQNTAHLDLSGGTANYGGDSGGFYMYGYNEAKNTGLIDVFGGTGIMQGGEGLSWFLEMYSTENVINSGRINGAGGDATTNGMDSLDIYMYAGQRTTNSNLLDASGGDATTNGGNGGFVDLFSQGAATGNSGSIDVKGGTGTTTGSIGTIFIDWMDVTDYTDGKL